MHHQSAPLNPVLMKPKSLVPSRRRFQDTDWPLARLNEIYFIYNTYIYIRNNIDVMFFRDNLRRSR